MKKLKLGPKNFLYPMPVILAGANVDGKPNYVAVAYCGIVQNQPPMIEITLNKARYTSIGIKENQTFSVNLPSEQMAEVTDYCGMVSGHKTDKSKLFTTFYGELETAPMIEECPLVFECKVVKILDLDSTHEIFIGEIIQTYVGEDYLTNDLPDIKKMNPFVFSMYDRHYWKVGEQIGAAYTIGKDYKK